jgi:hypothetical protein
LGPNNGRPGPSDFLNLRLSLIKSMLYSTIEENVYA